MSSKNATSSSSYISNNCFIDGQNLETGLRIENLEIDYQLLFEYLVKTYKTKNIFYCVKFSKHKSRQVNFEKMKKIGYNLIFSSSMGNQKRDGSHKVNVDADLIVLALEEYFLNEKFALILISGDGDFVPLIRFFEKQNQFVKIIAASKKSISSMLIFDRYKNKKRFVTYVFEELSKLTKKISPLRGSGGIDET